jgi:hypothetical protein
MDQSKSVATPPLGLDAIGRLVRDRTLSQLMSQIYDERDPEIAERLRLMLIDEADRFGQLQERMDKVGRLIDEVRIRIENQGALVERLWRRGFDISMACSILENYEKTYKMLGQYLEILQAKIDIGYV